MLHAGRADQCCMKNITTREFSRYKELIAELGVAWAQARNELDPSRKHKGFEIYYLKYKIYLELKDLLVRSGQLA